MKATIVRGDDEWGVPTFSIGLPVGDDVLVGDAYLICPEPAWEKNGYDEAVNEGAKTPRPMLVVAESAPDKLRAVLNEFTELTSKLSAAARRMDEYDIVTVETRPARGERQVVRGNTTRARQIPDRVRGVGVEHSLLLKRMAV